MRLKLSRVKLTESHVRETGFGGHISYYLKVLEAAHA